MAFGGSPVKSIQRGTISLGTGSGAKSATATIASVDPLKSTISQLGQDTTAAYNDVSHGTWRIELTDGTTVTAFNGNTGNHSYVQVHGYEVIERV